MGEFNLPQDPVPFRRVNIYIPRDVAFNLDRMFDITKTVLKKLGCDGCHSGRVLDFHIIEDFVVNPQGEVKELPGGFQF